MTRAAALLLIAFFAAMLPANAQEDPAGGSFITPFPANDVYQVLVAGDSLAEGLVEGLAEAFTGDARLQIDRKARSISGLMRVTYEEQLKELEDSLSGQTIHIAVVAVGSYDRISVRTREDRWPVGSDEWKAEYGRRIDRLIRLLKQKKSVVYWVGLPVVRRPNANDEVQMMNEIARERAYLNGQKFIDAYAGFVDESGAYSAYGPDLTGKIRLLRDGDEFTGAGYRKLAHFVERELKRDLVTAKNDRSIPLAGAEDEQARINAVKTPGAPGKPPPAPAGEAGTAPPRPANPWTPTAGQIANAGGDQKADNGRLSFKAPGAGGRDEVVTVDIPRPPISASVLALVTRRESPDRPSQMGDALVDQIPGGLTVMSSITPASESGAGARRKVSPTQSSFFRVLVRGERMTPKPGRADDASWPRPGTIAAAEPEKTAAPPPGAAAPDKRE